MTDTLEPLRVVPPKYRHDDTTEADWRAEEAYFNRPVATAYGKEASCVFCGRPTTDDDTCHRCDEDERRATA